MINEENESSEILERKWYDEGIFKFSINYYFGCQEKEFGDNKLNELIQKKIIVSFSFFDSLREMDDIGIIIWYNSEYIGFLTIDKIYMITKISIDSIIIQCTPYSHLVSSKFNYINEINKLFDDKIVLDNLSDDTIKLVEGYIGYEFFKEKKLSKLNLESFQLFTCLKQSNIIVGIQNDQYYEKIIGKIIEVGTNSVKILAIDQNQILITNLVNLKFYDIVHVDITPERTYLKNIIDYYQENDMLNKAVQIILPNTRFNNTFKIGQYESMCKHNYYNLINNTPNNNDLKFNYTIDFIEKLTFLSENLDDYKDVNSMINLNSSVQNYNLEKTLQVFDVIRSRLTKNDESKFILKKIILKDERIFNELLLLGSNDLYYIAKDKSIKDEGYFLINKSSIKIIQSIYLNKFRKERLSSEIPFEILRLMDGSMSINEFLVGKFLIIHTNNFQNNITMFVNKCDDNGLEGNILEYYCLQNSTKFCISNIAAINFYSKNLDEIKSNYDYIKDKDITKKFSSLYSSMFSLAKVMLKSYDTTNIEEFYIFRIFIYDESIINFKIFNDIDMFVLDVEIDVGDDYEIDEEYVSVLDIYDEDDYLDKYS